MSRLLIFAALAAMLSGCQTADDALTTQSDTTTVSDRAASAIAGDIASRFAEQSSSADRPTIRMDKSTNGFAAALEAALKGWGYVVVTDGKIAKGSKLVELSYSINVSEGQVLATLSTPSLALARAYAITPDGAAPASPLSIMQRS